ncbi:MAG TPA: phenylalanine--tRNA ligase beta subunit-related protein, partial [Thermoanaerobaculia bacterium]
MRPVSFPVTHELSGWELFWARLEALPGQEEALAALRRQAGERARAEWSLETLSADPTVAAVRSLFRAAGCDPTRYRPSSEALLRRLLKGEDLPSIHPLVDLNNCLSVELAVPCCVAAEGTFTPPVTLRAGHPGETV